MSELGRIQSETDDGVLYVDTGFGSQMQIVRPRSKFLEELKETKLGCKAYSIIQSYLYLVLECTPEIDGCDPDEQERRLKALLKALETKRPRKRKSSANLGAATTAITTEQKQKPKSAGA